MSTYKSITLTEAQALYDLGIQFQFAYEDYDTGADGWHNWFPHTQGPAKMCKETAYRVQIDG